MILAKVVGTVVATRKDERLVASKLLVALCNPDHRYLKPMDHKP